MMFRRVRRAVTLAMVLALCVLRYWLRRIHGPLTLEQRADWLQDAARMILRALGIGFHVEGKLPACGLVVANHLSYLDVIIISAAMPCFFVAKMEIGNWPYFGKAARTGGTIFVDRSSLASAMSVAEQISERLSLPVPVLLFPEGTSTDGAEVLRFHSRLIDPATTAGAPITAAALRYVIEGGVEERELCWYGDEPFATHLWKVLGVTGFSAELCFGEPRIYPHRRVAADRTHAEITAWREANALATENVMAAQ
jgi:1-acyl-sn-glycerol-3-phosphate acyltransferase